MTLTKPKTSKQISTSLTYILVIKKSSY